MKEKFTENNLQKALDYAIAHGNLEEAEKLVEELYTLEDQQYIEMPQDFPMAAIALAEKERNEKIMKKSVMKKVLASAAAFAIVLSFGITAYAQGWFQSPVNVLEDKNAVVTGENINTDNYDAALAKSEEDSKKDIYKKSEFSQYPDFVTACEALGMPGVTIGYLEEHPEFATLKGRVYAYTNPEDPNIKGVYSDYFSNIVGDSRGISMSIEYQENPDDVIAAFDEKLRIENNRTFTTTAGDTFTVYDLYYEDYEGEYITETHIAINNYLINIMFSGIGAEEIESALNSVDLSQLKAN